MNVVTCPSCKRSLHVPAGAREAGLTCPACLAEIDVSSLPDAPAGAPSGAGETVTCDVCAEEIPAFSFYCPICGERTGTAMAGGTLPPYGGLPSPAAQVKRDSKSIGPGSIVLAILGVFGAAGLLPAFLAGGDPDATAGLGLVLLVGMLALLGTGIYLSTRRGDPTEAGIGRIIVKTLAGLGILALALVGLAVGALVFLFVVCISGGHF